MKNKSFILAAIFCVVTATSNANSRLEMVREIYTNEVDEYAELFTKMKIHQVYLGIMGYFEDAFSSFDKNVNLAKLAKTWFNGNRTVVTQILDGNNQVSLKFFKNLKHDLHQANTAKVQFVETSQRLEYRTSNIEKLKANLADRDLCTEFISEEIFPELPRYSFDEQIHTDHIPKPESQKIGGFANSGNSNLDNLAAGAVGTISTGGCALGTTLGGPFAPLGCIIGAGVGALAGFFLGYAAQAAYIGIENWQLWDVYESQVRIEVARQKNEINEARDFTIQHPIDVALILSRAIPFCQSMENSRLNLKNYDSKEVAAPFILKASEADFEITEYQQILKNILQDLKESLVREIPGLLKNREATFAMVKEFKNLANGIDELRSSLYRCLANSEQNIEYKRSCLHLTINETQDFFEANGQQLRSDRGLNQLFLNWLDELQLLKSQAEEK